MSNNLDGQSRSRRSARPFILAIVALGVLLAVIVFVAQPRETRDGARSNVVAGEPAVADQTAPQMPANPPGGQGTRDMPDLGPPLDSKTPPNG